MKTIFEILLFMGIGFVILMTVSWAFAMRFKFLSLVDAVWAIGIALGAIASAFIYGQNIGRSIFAGALASFWGLRLGIHLVIRLRRHFPAEDIRYQALRLAWKNGLLWKTYLFFIFQAFTQTLFVYPFVILVIDPEIFPRSIEVMGALLCIVAVLGETLSDAQLKQFKSDPSNHGQVCKVGLWRYSRHPNYFFEWLIWCGFAISALKAPFGIYAIICPIVMLLLLLFVTGVHPSEKQSLKSRGNLYREYQNTTSAFIPWFPKNKGKEASLPC